MDIKFGENLKRMRKERSLTQEALADALGVTAGAVYKWEAGLSSPELEMLMRIADLFDGCERDFKRMLKAKKCAEYEEAVDRIFQTKGV